MNCLDRFCFPTNQPAKTRGTLEQPVCHSLQVRHQSAPSECFQAIICSKFGLFAIFTAGQGCKKGFSPRRSVACRFAMHERYVVCQFVTACCSKQAIYRRNPERGIPSEQMSLLVTMPFGDLSQGVFLCKWASRLPGPRMINLNSVST